ncbi:MAG: nicotinamide-nucleotide amidase [gamma proteobacterium symbiont of Phacoides pectinatus]
MRHTVERLASELARRLAADGLALTCAESCTGGWLSKVLTDTPCSSRWFDRGFVTYSNAAKHSMLGVREETLARYGAVSAETVLEMAHGALANSCAALSVAISGIAGPGGGSAEKPVGTVWFAWADADGWSAARMMCFSGDREAVREHAVAAALEGLLGRLEGAPERAG